MPSPAILRAVGDGSSGHTGRTRLYSRFRNMPISCARVGGAPTGTAGDRNIVLVTAEDMDQGAFCVEYDVIGTQTLLSPVLGTQGLDISQDLTATDGVEYVGARDTRMAHCFTVGDDDIRFKCGIYITDVSGANPCIVGFQKVAALSADYNDYTDMAAIGFYGADIKIETILNNAATVTTDTTDNGADTTEYTFEVIVLKDGKTYYKVNGAAPTTVAAYTFTAGLVITPFVRLVHGADVANATQLTLWDSGKLG